MQILTANTHQHFCALVQNLTLAQTQNNKKNSPLHIVHNLKTVKLRKPANCNSKVLILLVLHYYSLCFSATTKKDKSMTLSIHLINSGHMKADR